MRNLGDFFLKKYSFILIALYAAAFFNKYQSNLKFKHEAFFFNPEKIFIKLNDPASRIKKTIHYINSWPVSYKYQEDVSKYIYLDVKPRDFQNFVKKTVLPKKNYKTTFYTLWGMFVKRDGYIFSQSTIWKQSFMQSQEQEASLIGYYDEVVCTGSIHSYINFGHSLQDFFHTLFIFPQEIIQRSMIVPGFIHCFMEILDIYNISRSQIIDMNFNDCIYCRIVHTMNPYGYISCYSVFSMKLKNLLFKKYHLDLYEPKYYCFMNRKKGKYRYINNFDEIYNYTVTQFPDINFVQFEDNLESVKDNAIRFAQMKFLFGPTGSNLVKTCFMHNNSVIVSAGTCDFYHQFDESVICAAVFSKIFFLQFRSPLKHFIKEETNVSVDLCFKYIKIGIYCTLNGHWPKIPL